MEKLHTVKTIISFRNWNRYSGDVGPENLYTFDIYIKNKRIIKEYAINSKTKNGAIDSTIERIEKILKKNI